MFWDALVPILLGIVAFIAFIALVEFIISAGIVLFFPGVLIGIGLLIPDPFNYIYFTVLGLIVLMVFGMDKIRNLVN